MRRISLVPLAAIVCLSCDNGHQSATETTTTNSAESDSSAVIDTSPDVIDTSPDQDTVDTVNADSAICSGCFEYGCLCVAPDREVCAAGAFSTLYSQCVDGHCDDQAGTCSERCRQLGGLWLQNPPPRPTSTDFAGTSIPIGEPLPLVLNSMLSPVGDPFHSGRWYALASAPGEGTTHILRITTLGIADVTPEQLLQRSNDTTNELAIGLAAAGGGMAVATRRYSTDGDATCTVYRYDGTGLIEAKTFPGADRLSIDSDGSDTYITGTTADGGFIGRLSNTGYEPVLLGPSAFEVRAATANENGFWVAIVDLASRQPKLFAIKDGQPSERGTFPVSDWIIMALDGDKLEVLDTFVDGSNQLFERDTDGTWTERCAPTFQIWSIGSLADGRLMIITHDEHQTFVAEGQSWIRFEADSVFGRDAELYEANSPIGTYTLVISRLTTQSRQPD